MTAFRAALVTLLALAAVELAVTQTDCSDNGECNNLVHVSQCGDAASLSQCCRTCTDLAGCQDFVMNCALRHPSECYSDGVQGDCCRFCKINAKEYLGSSCVYGNKDPTFCSTKDVSDCGDPNVEFTCCELCYTGTTPNFTPSTTCVDSGDNCAARVEEVPSTCYISELASDCCSSCKAYKERRGEAGFDTMTCPYGDRGTSCLEPRDTLDCTDDLTAFVCCDSCLPQTTTTTTPPPMCEDQFTSCADQVRDVPSICYNDDSNTLCCQSCQSFMSSRMQEGVNVAVCPYGDRQADCDSDLDCSSPSTSFFCCDTCLEQPDTTTVPMSTTPCFDTGSITCSEFPQRFCYEDVNGAYNGFCCGTCQAKADYSLGMDCLYGDKSDNCMMVVPGECTDQQLENCCESCRPPATTTTEDPCQDKVDCSALVTSASDCYNIGGSCCATCRKLAVPGAPPTCTYGDRISSCTPDNCGDFPISCCGTCSAITTQPATTTEQPCVDTRPNCNAAYDIINVPRRCYNDAVLGECCATCTLFADQDSPMCPYGDRDVVCMSDVDCRQDEIRDLCCDKCRGVTRPTTTLPPNCEDSLGTCDDLTTPPDTCYPEVSSFVSSRCCSTCFSKRKPNLPPGCPWGNREGYCLTVANEELCENDAQLANDCCETCYSFVRTTPQPGTTVCPNVYGDTTCDAIYNELNGNCSSIIDKCCRTCTLRAATTTMPTTTEEPCSDVLATDICQRIITLEGVAECFTQFVQENCCGSCRAVVTTSTTTVSTMAPACPGDDLPNCALIQNITTTDICNATDSLREACCDFCGDNLTPPPTTTMRITTTSDCDEDLLGAEVCDAIIRTSELDDPCVESDIVSEQCCDTCKQRRSTTTASNTGPPCDGDSPAVNCEGLDASVTGDICMDEKLRPLCCEYCGGRVVTGTTTTVASSTPAATTAPCSGDTIRDCPDVDRALDDRLCDHTFARADFFRPSCCAYCQRTTTEPTTTVDTCVDDPSVAAGDCIIVVQQDLCNETLGSQCCATCRDFVPSTAPPTTTTTEPPTTTTAVCEDNPQVDCADIDSQPTGNACGSFFLSSCCAYCASRPTTVTFPPCFGNVLSPTTCQEQFDDDPTICDSPDSGFATGCCEFCNRTVIVTTTTPVPCVEDTINTCGSELNSDPDLCADALKASFCCVTCGSQSRRKRSVDAEESLRVKRQSPCPPVEEEDYYTCEGLYDVDQSICESVTVRSICCNFCAIVDEKKSGESAIVDLPAPSKRVELQPITSQSQPKRLWDYLSYAIGLN